MKSSDCRICHQKATFVMTGLLREQYTIDYFECTYCGFVQTEQPYWLEEAYSTAINDSDTGLLQRNLYNVKNVIVILKLLKKLQGTVVDYAGGYGLLVRLLRDYGVNAYWYDKYCENLFAKGFDFNTEIANIDLLTAFEVFEHLVAPDVELAKMFNLTPSIFFSTLIIPTPTPRPEDWWYYGLNHGQHIGFYRVKTLQYLAKKHNKQLITDGIGFHLLTDKKINKQLFSMLIKYSFIFARVFKRSLVSKTFSDHEYCQNLSKKN